MAAGCSKVLPSVKLHGVITAECDIDTHCCKNLISSSQFAISPLHLRVCNFGLH